MQEEEEKEEKENSPDISQFGRDMSNLSVQNRRHKPRNAKVQALAEHGIHPNVIRNESV